MFYKYLLLQLFAFLNFPYNSNLMAIAIINFNFFIKFSSKLFAFNDFLFSRNVLSFAQSHYIIFLYFLQTKFETSHVSNFVCII